MLISILACSLGFHASLSLFKIFIMAIDLFKRLVFSGEIEITYGLHSEIKFLYKFLSHCAMSGPFADPEPLSLGW